MLNFMYGVPSMVHFEKGKMKDTGIILRESGVKCVLIVSDQSMTSLGLTAKMVGILQEQELETAVFDRVLPNPTDALVAEGVAFAKKNGVDSIVALGGGSVIDCAKAINILMTNDGSISDYEGANKVDSPGLLLVMIPTTSGTASEVTGVSVITDTERHKKMVIAGRFVGGAVAICDPLLTLALPPAITAATGMDALTHAIEAYISKIASPVTDVQALESIRLISENLEPAVKKGSYEFRESMMLGSVMAGFAFNSAMLGLVHSLAHPLSAHYNIAHGVANAVFLPHVIAYNMGSFDEKVLPLATAMGICVEGMEKSELGDAIVDFLKNLSSRIGIPAFRDLNIPPSDFQMLAEEAMEELSTFTNPKETDAIQLKKLIESVWSAGLAE